MAPATLAVIDAYRKPPIRRGTRGGCTRVIWTHASAAFRAVVTPSPHPFARCQVAAARCLLIDGIRGTSEQRTTPLEPAARLPPRPRFSASGPKRRRAFRLRRLPAGSQGGPRLRLAGRVDWPGDRRGR